MIDVNGAVVVLGLGNVLHTDDAVGVRVIQRLRDVACLPPGITLIDGGTLGLELLSIAAGAQRLLVVDAIEAGVAAGTLVRYGHQELRALAGGASAHELGLGDLLAALSLLGAEPEEIVLLGLQPASLVLGTTLSPAVEAGLDDLNQAVLAEIARWTSAPGVDAALDSEPAGNERGSVYERSRLCAVVSPHR